MFDGHLRMVSACLVQTDALAPLVDTSAGLRWLMLSAFPYAGTSASLTTLRVCSASSIENVGSLVSEDSNEDHSDFLPSDIFHALTLQDNTEVALSKARGKRLSPELEVAMVFVSGVSMLRTTTLDVVDALALCFCPDHGLFH
nr:hypothetical protein CFP56_21938 [Quercus suber]